MPPRAIASRVAPPSAGRLRAVRAAGTPAPSTAGTSARRRSRRDCGSNSRASVRDRAVEDLARSIGARGQRRLLVQVLAQRRRRPGRTSSPRFVPGVGQRLEHLPERRLPVPRLVREVGAGEERVAVVVEHAGHRPAAVPGHRRGRLHVDRVDVGPLLAVDLDADEVLVEVRRRRLVLERLVRHHVAPVAGGVPDAQQHRHVAPPGLLERRPAPTPTSRPGCRRAGAGTARSRPPVGWALPQQTRQPSRVSRG